MEILKAIQILNEVGHNGVSDWRYSTHQGNIVTGEIGTYRFTEFEAIAIAEKYERDGGA